MVTRYMLFKEGRDNITDTLWFVNHFVDSVYIKSELKWIAAHPLDFEDGGVIGVYSENGDAFTFISKYRCKDIPKDWIEVRPNNIIGEI